MALTNAAAGFIGASVTLVLVIIFMILMVILVRQCLAFVSKRNAIRSQMEHQQQIREQIRQRRGSVTEPIPATFDWHHSIRIAGTPPPSYGEAKELPSFEDAADGETATGNTKEDGAGSKHTTAPQANGVHVTVQKNMEVVVQVEEQNTSSHREHTSQAPESNRTFTSVYTEFSSA